MLDISQRAENFTCEHHTPRPDCYLHWEYWAEAPIRCPCCGLWLIWLPKHDAINRRAWKEQNVVLRSQGLKPIKYSEY